MKQLHYWMQNILKKNQIPEKGQSIVIIAFILIALLLFAGIAVDVGFIFARNSQLQAAVDAAALAGVPELIEATNENDTEPADIRAGMFLNTNGVPITNTQGISIVFSSSRNLTELGDTEYSITVTWPVELYFLRLIRDDDVNLTKSATATINTLADIYASRRVEEGNVSTSTQGIFGPQICINYGDPFSPWTSPFEPNVYTYQYRIMVPASYSHDILRVELFDPDSINSANNEATVTRSALVQNGAAVNPVLGAITTKFCGIDTDPENGRQDFTCVLPTDELNYLDSPLTLDQINPYWFMRIDENRGNPATQHGDGSCQVPDNYTVGLNTQTKFELYYYRGAADGSPIKAPLATYTGQTDDYRDQQIHPTGTPGDHNTDLFWVSPGAVNQGTDFDSLYGTSHVPVDPDSANDSFEIDLTADVPGIITDPGTGARFINLDVTAISGASENGFEIWAGPPTYVNTVPANVNQRNVVVTNTPGAHYSGGAVVFALGRLPMNSIFNNQVDIPLVFVGSEQAGETMTVSLWDSDSGAQPPIEFYFDSISDQDWSLVFGQDGVPDPDGETRTCVPGSCDGQWVLPAYNITIPGLVDNCDYANADTDPNCTPFYGGRLMARYIGGTNDTFTWQIQLNGLPRLVR
ncbi:MAG: pilus assembly protein TadG-related protein [Chloroflexota bacterium]